MHEQGVVRAHSLQFGPSDCDLPFLFIYEYKYPSIYIYTRSLYETLWLDQTSLFYLIVRGSSQSFRSFYSFECLYYNSHSRSRSCVHSKHILDFFSGQSSILIGYNCSRGLLRAAIACLTESCKYRGIYMLDDIPCWCPSKLDIVTHERAKGTILSQFLY